MRLRISARQVEALEHHIDRFNDELNPLTSFILPGGAPGSAYVHLARTIVRRAECDVVELAANEPVNEEVLKYVNRLSDLLFVLGRYLNARGTADVLWTPECEPLAMQLVRQLWFQVLVGMIGGILLGLWRPRRGADDAARRRLHRLVRMMIAPVIFCTVVHGVAA